MTNGARKTQRSSPLRSSRAAIALIVLAGLLTTEAAAQPASDRIVGVYRLAHQPGWATISFAGIGSTDRTS